MRNQASDTTGAPAPELHEQASAAFAALVDSTAAILMKGGAPVDRGAAGADDATLPPAARLGLASRQREQAWRQARETAELLVIGTLLNQDNPDWNPADPSTCRVAEPGPLLALLQADGDGDGVS